MSRAAIRARIKKADARRAREHRHSKPKPVRRTSDQAIYLGLGLVGGFLVILVWLLTDARYWREVLLGYLIAVGWLINLYTFQVYRGVHLPNWKQALARVPLRFAGYGTRDGKPLDAARNQPNAKLALLVSIAACVAVVLGLTLALFPEVRT
jgi:hypothetical protein